MSILSKGQPPSERKLKELFKLGAHFGFSRSRRHPSTDSFIFGFKNRQAVIDLEKTLQSLQAAKTLVEGLAASGKLILWVGSKSEARSAVAAAAMTISQPYVNERWLGGTLTNFKEMRRRVARLLEIRETEETGGLDKYTKKERAVIAKEKDRLERYFGSLVNLTAIPGALVVVDAAQEAIAVAEANKVGVPVISIANSDCDIRPIAYPIVANDGSQATIRHLLQELVAAYEAGRAAAAKVDTAVAGTPATE